ncbi:MAG: hypothetical protein LBQ52_09995 [Helicobacteraceae bacterium]|jgi:hypothetical protein|nr:hypothetical protein [Helicobacteraceae bacterium]
MVRVKLWHILTALCAALFILLLWRVAAKNALIEARLENQKIAQTAERIVRLRSEWESSQAVKSKAQTLFNDEALKQRGNAQQNAQGIKAEYRNLDATALSRLTRTLLESPIPLKSFSAERKGDQSADVSLEIVW